MSKKLFRIALSPRLGDYYVLDEEPTGAYVRLRAELDRRDIGTPRDRVLTSITLVAEDEKYPECGVRLMT